MSGRTKREPLTPSLSRREREFLVPRAAVESPLPTQGGEGEGEGGGSHA